MNLPSITLLASQMNYYIVRFLITKTIATLETVIRYNNGMTS